MTLLQQFEKALKDNAEVEITTDGVILNQWYEKDAQQCVSITDEQMIKFAEWVDKELNGINYSKWQNKETTTLDLLTEYKKQNNL